MSNHQRYIKAIFDSTKHIVFATGPAGSGKTYLATQNAIKLLKQNQYQKIIITRPAIGTGEEHGFLPGNLDKKMEPWTRPIFDVFYENYRPHQVEKMLKNHIIEISPLAYMRGRTFKKSLIIGDEMQNASISQMKMFLTRIGEGSKMIVNGDIEQSDSNNSGLKDFLEKMRENEISSISSIEFDKKDIRRHEVIEEVLNIYHPKYLTSK